MVERVLTGTDDLGFLSCAELPTVEDNDSASSEEDQRRVQASLPEASRE